MDLWVKALATKPAGLSSTPRCLLFSTDATTWGGGACVCACKHVCTQACVHVQLHTHYNKKKTFLMAIVVCRHTGEQCKSSVLGGAVVTEKALRGSCCCVLVGPRTKTDMQGACPRTQTGLASATFYGPLRYRVCSPG